MTTHCLKTEQPFFGAIREGLKTFEIRNNDRVFKVGDILCLEEYRDGEYSGSRINRRVSYICDWMQQPGYVVMSLADVDDPDPRPRKERSTDSQEALGIAEKPFTPAFFKQGDSVTIEADTDFTGIYIYLNDEADGWCRLWVPGPPTFDSVFIRCERSKLRIASGNQTAAESMRLFSEFLDGQKGKQAP